MSHSNPFRPDHRAIADEDGESMDSIPWESIDTLGRGRDRRRWYVLAAVIVVVGVGFSAARNLGISSPEPLATTTTPLAAADTTPPTTTTSAPDPGVVTEADLMAIEPHTFARAAMAFAEVAAVEYFTGAGQGIWAEVEFDRSRTTFVEYATAVQATPLEPFLFDVLVAVSVLDAAPGEDFVRRPARGVSILVDTSDDLRPLGLPAPAALPFRSFRSPTSETDPVDDATLEAIHRAAEKHGEVRSIEFRKLASGGGDATVTLVDEGGISWPMRFEVDADGEVLSSD